MRPLTYVNKLLRGGDQGASLVEYAMLVLMIALVALVAVQLAGATLGETYVDIASDLVEAGS